MTEAIYVPTQEASPLNGLLMIVLCFLFGIFGAHRFYAGRTRSAVVQLLTLGGLGIWTVVDLLVIVFAEFRDAAGRRIDPWKDM